MIVTVTPNTGIDHVLFVASLPKHRTIRAESSVLGMAGKPTDASYVLGELGLPSLALGFAAGSIGRAATCRQGEYFPALGFLGDDGDGDAGALPYL